MISNTVILTNQFYAWEKRGRGWATVDFACDLEPPFVPFFGHFIETSGIIDDGKRPSFWNSLLSGFNEQDADISIPPADEPIAFPYSATAGLTMYTVTLPKNFKPSKERIEQVLVMLSYRKTPVSCEIVATGAEIVLQWLVQDADAAFFHSQLRAFFPECAIVETYTDKVLQLLNDAPCTYTVDFGLAQECMRPIAAKGNADPDPFLPLFGMLDRLDDTEAVIMQVLFCGVQNPWGESMEIAVCDNSGKTSFFFDAPDMPQLAREKTAMPLVAATVRVATISDTMEEAATLLQHVATAVVHATISNANSFIPLHEDNYPVTVRLADIVMRETHRVGMLLNISELSTLVHFPSVPSKKLHSNNRTTKQAPGDLIGHPYVLGVNGHQHIERKVSIPTSQRVRHIHILGSTGTGKSTLLKSLIMQDVLDGTGLMCLDPHGDLIDDILCHIPEHRIQDVVLIDPHDAEFPVALNILVAHSDIEKELLASDLVAVFRRFSTSWGDAMNSILANAILAFLYNSKQYHLGDLRRFLIEVPYRTAILSTVTDPDIVYYWQTEYPLLRSNSIGSILTRLDAFLRPKVIRNMVAQKKSLDFAQLMDSNKIVLVKLSEGLLGSENSYLLGAFIVSKLQQTAMARQSQMAKDRVPFFCYVDEFQHFVTPSMASILSGARKYGVGLVLSHQDMQQVARTDVEIAGSVLANAATRIVFRVGDADAKRLEDGFNSFSASDLQNLATGEAIARVNTADGDCNLSVVPYKPHQETNFTQEIIRYSRDLYSVPVQQKTDPPVEPIAAAPQPVAKKDPVKTVPMAEEPIVEQQTLHEHRYLQTFVKAMAEAHGYKASIEVPTPDGAGLVDVLLEKGTETIAVEISVTTTPEWELHNIQKCLAAGYSRIVVCSAHAAKLKAIQQQISAQVPLQEQRNIHVIASSDIQTIFATTSPAQPTETLVKGYRVKVNYESNPNRQDLLQSIINAGKKR